MFLLCIFAIVAKVERDMGGLALVSVLIEINRILVD